MSLLFHVLGGIGVMVLMVWLVWRGLHIERTVDAQLPDKLIKFVTLGSDSTRDAWLWRLRAANFGMATVALIGAIALFATA